jgi:hypothetical protein
MSFFSLGPPTRLVQVRQLLSAVATSLGVRHVTAEERDPSAVPFNVIPWNNPRSGLPTNVTKAAVGAAVARGLEKEEGEGPGDHDGGGHQRASIFGGSASPGSPQGRSNSSSSRGGASTASVEELTRRSCEVKRELEAQREAVRRLKEGGLRGNADPEVKQHVKELLRLKARDNRKQSRRCFVLQCTPVHTPIVLQSSSCSVLHSPTAPLDSYSSNLCTQ